MSDVDEPRLSIIPGWVVTCPDLKGKDLQVLCILGRNANRRHGWTRRSQVKIAEQLGCARSTVQASINRLVEIGAVERREVVSENGRDSAHWYRVIYDAAPPAGYDFDAYRADEEEECGPISDAEDEAPPAGIPAPPAGPESAPPAGPESAPMLNTSCLTPPEEREREGASANEGREENPKELARRFKALEIGLHGNPWPNVLKSSSDWGLRQFIALSPDERRLAEERRDAYLAACPKVTSGQRKGEPDAVPIGVYLRDRKFIDVAAIAPRLVKRDQAMASVHVAPFGPIWAGMRMMSLLDGPRDINVPDDLHASVLSMFEALRRISQDRARNFLARKGVGLDEQGQPVFPDDFEQEERRRRVTESGYPEVNHLHDQAKQRTNSFAPPVYGSLSPLMEAVPVGSTVYEEWSEEHVRRGWPLWPDPGGMPVIYFPKGGPDGLEDFKMAALAVMADARNGASDDAA